jgi:hypothetical protein
VHNSYISIKDISISIILELKIMIILDSQGIHAVNFENLNSQGQVTAFH